VDLPQDGCDLTIQDLKDAIQSCYQYPADAFSLYDQRNRMLDLNAQLFTLNSQLIEIQFRLLGGKGGFGSLLRSKTSRGKKVRDFGACRDLLGRRIRHANNQQEIEEWGRRREEQQEKLAAELEESQRRNHNQLASSTSGKAKPQVDTKFVSKVGRCSSSISSSLKMIAAQKKQRKANGKRAPEHDTNDLNQELETSSSPKKFKEEEVKTNDQGHQNGSEVLEEQKGGISVSDKPDEGISSCVGSVSKDNSTMMKADEDTTSKRETSKKEPVEEKKEATEEKSYEHVDLTGYNSLEQLLKIGADHLKAELKRLGLKCGGTLQMRAERLWMLKSCPLEKLPKKLFAK